MNLFSIQDTFEEVRNDVDNNIVEKEDIWVASRNMLDEDHQSLYYLTVSKDGIKDKYQNVELKPLRHKRYELIINKNSVILESFNCKIQLPIDRDLTAVSITSDFSYLVGGTSDGTIFLYNLKNGEFDHSISNAHEGNVTVLKFFPSNKVFISGGIDLRIKIWSLEGQAARTMVHQKRPISSLGLLGPTGRYFLSGSLDGSLCLWECGSSEMVQKFNRILNLKDPVNCMALGFKRKGNMISHGSHEEDVLAYVGYNSGTIQEFDITERCQSRVVLEALPKVAVTKLSVKDEILISGHAKGYIRIWNIEQGSLLSEHRICSEDITNLQILSLEGSRLELIISAGPDALFKATSDFRSLDPAMYFVGMPENSRVSSISCVGDTIVAGAGDAFYIYNTSG